MNVSYTKANPKVHDYNPITHSPTFSKPDTNFVSSKPFAQRSPSLLGDRKDSNFERLSQFASPKSSLAFSGKLNIKDSHSLSPEKYINTSLIQQRFYKNKPRSRAADPILGIKDMSGSQSFIQQNTKPKNDAFNFFRDNNASSLNAELMDRPNHMRYASQNNPSYPEIKI